MGLQVFPSSSGGDISSSLIDAKGNLLAGTAADTVAALAVGANETRLVADSVAATGLKYVADTTNYAIAAKGNLLAGTAADTVAALAVGANNTVLTADSSTATGLKWAAPAVSAPSWSLLSTTNTTSGTSVTLTGLSGYNQFMLIFNGNSANAGRIFRLQFNNVTSGNKYNYNGISRTGTGFNVFNETANHIETSATDTTDSVIRGYLFLQGGNSAGLKVGHWAVGSSGSSNLDIYRWGGFIFDDTAVISEIKFFPHADNFDAGSIKLYGSVI